MFLCINGLIVADSSGGMHPAYSRLSNILMFTRVFGITLMLRLLES
jgi:hypothetical protein